MEPFKTKLEQVTFSPSDQLLNDHSAIDSFSNVVAYDLELVNEAETSVQRASTLSSFQESGAARPQPAPSLPVSPVSVPSSNTSSQWSYRSESRDGEEGIVNIGYQVYFQSPLVQLVKPAHPYLVCYSGHPRLDDPTQPAEFATEAREREAEPEITLPETEHPGVHGHAADDRDQTILSALRRAKRLPSSSLPASPVPGGIRLQPQDDHSQSASIHNQATDVDALTLQRSVLGPRSELVEPATEEAVEFAIAQAKEKLARLLPAQETSVPLLTPSNGGNHQLPALLNAMAYVNNQRQPALTGPSIGQLTTNIAPPIGLFDASPPPIGHLTLAAPSTGSINLSATSTGHYTTSKMNGPILATSPTAPFMTRSPVSPTVGSTLYSVSSHPTAVSEVYHLTSISANARPKLDLIPIPASEITVTKEGGRATKTYQVPNEDLKNKLKAKARSHAGKGIKKRGLRTPSDQGSETGRSTPSELGDADMKSYMSQDSMDASSAVKYDSSVFDDSELRNSGKLNSIHLDISDLTTQPKPVRSSTPSATPGKMPQSQDMIRYDPSDVTKLLREKAHLQGQVEMLKSEAKIAVKDRSDLQAQLGAVKSQVRSSSGAGIFPERDTLMSDLQHIKMDRDRLLEREEKLRKLLEEKTQESSLVKVELDSARKMNQKLQIRLDSNKQDAFGKSGELDELKNRLAVVGQELQSLRQEKRSVENQLRSSRNEIQAMVKTKDWYQEQLKTAQETRSSLQKEVSKMQIHAMEQSSAIERLKSENTHMKHQMSESHQRALQEKETLVKHLEKIEADMLEREAAVQQLQTDRATNEGSLYERIKKVEEEKHQMAALLMTTNDLQNEIAKMKSELSQKDEHIALLKKDHSQMIKQVTLNQETAAEKQKELESLERRFLELEVHMNEVIGNSSHKDSEILSLKDQKASLEVSLSSANEEKRTIDSALENLRSDMETVENSFRMMKAEMARKNQSLKEVNHRNKSLEMELDKSREHAQIQLKSFDELNRTVTGKSVIVNDLNAAREKLESETQQLNREILNLRFALDQTSSEKQVMQHLIQDSEKRIHDLSEKLSQAITEKMQLQNSVHLANSEELAEVQKENTTLRAELTELQVDYNKALEKKQKEVERLEKDVWKTQEKLDDLKAKHSEEMRVVGDRLREAGEAQQMTEQQAADLRKQLSDGAVVGEEKNHLEHEIQMLKESLGRAEADRERLQTDLATLSHIAQTDADKQQTVQQLQRQLSEANETLEEYKISRDESLKLALELEREKGRLSGVMQSHAALKQHTIDLEGLLAEKQSSIVDLTVRTQQKLNEMSCHSSATNQRIEELEQRIQYEQEVVHQLREQLSSEKLESARLSREKETLVSEQEQISRDLTELTEQLEQYRGHLNAANDRERSLSMEVENLREDYQNLQAELASLTRQLEQTREKDPVVDDTIKTLHWEIDQRSAELRAWQEQKTLAEHRQKVEMDTIRKTLKTTKEELDKLRGELSQTRKERFNYQAKLSELRGTVKACLKGSLDDSSSTDVQVELVNGSPENDHQSALLIIDKILDDSTTPEYDSKPLAALHQCMTSLRNQMLGLREEIDQHTLTVTSTSESWKLVENQVKELRDLCSSDDCSVRSDADSVASGQAAEDLVQKLLNGQSKLHTEPQPEMTNS